MCEFKLDSSVYWTNTQNQKQIVLMSWC